VQPPQRQDKKRLLVTRSAAALCSRLFLDVFNAKQSSKISVLSPEGSAACPCRGEYKTIAHWQPQFRAELGRIHRNRRCNIHNADLLHQGNSLQGSILTSLLEHPFEYLVDIDR
jgi:hypothetical protein